jgi:hypothetical protein
MYNLPTSAVWTAAVAVEAGPGWRSSRGTEDRADALPAAVAAPGGVAETRT